MALDTTCEHATRGIVVITLVDKNLGKSDVDSAR